MRGKAQPGGSRVQRGGERLDFRISRPCRLIPWIAASHAALRGNRWELNIPKPGAIPVHRQAGAQVGFADQRRNETCFDRTERSAGIWKPQTLSREGVRTPREPTVRTSSSVCTQGPNDTKLTGVNHGITKRARSRVRPSCHLHQGYGVPGEIKTSYAHFLAILAGFHKRGTDPLGSIIQT